MDRIPLKSEEYRTSYLELIRDLKAYSEDFSSTDVVFVTGVEEQHVRAHSFIVAARCPKIAKHFSVSPSRACGTGCVTEDESLEWRFYFRDISPAIMQALVTYMYTGSIRVRGESAFALMHAGSKLGLESLVNIAEQHVISTTDPSHALRYLASASSLGVAKMEAFILQYIVRHTKKVVGSVQFCRAPSDIVFRIVKQDELGATEEEIWSALIRRACWLAALPLNLAVSDMNALQKKDIVPFVKPFLKPGFLRILDMNSAWFAREVHALGILSADEVLLKYRYDAASRTLPMERAVPYDKIALLMRIRQSTMTFESVSHPHPQGITSVVALSFPVWTRFIQIEFDPRCELGRYADLSFFEDSDCNIKLASLQVVLASARLARRHELSANASSTKPSVKLPYRQIWFKFYSPCSFRPGWGYLFFVKPFVV